MQQAPSTGAAAGPISCPVEVAGNSARAPHQAHQARQRHTHAHEPPARVGCCVRRQLATRAGAVASTGPTRLHHDLVVLFLLARQLGHAAVGQGRAGQRQAMLIKQLEGGASWRGQRRARWLCASAGHCRALPLNAAQVERGAGRRPVATTNPGRSLSPCGASLNRRNSGAGADFVPVPVQAPPAAGLELALQHARHLARIQREALHMAHRCGATARGWRPASTLSVGTLGLACQFPAKGAAALEPGQPAGSTLLHLPLPHRYREGAGRGTEAQECRLLAARRCAQCAKRCQHLRGAAARPTGDIAAVPALLADAHRLHLPLAHYLHRALRQQQRAGARAAVARPRGTAGKAGRPAVQRPHRR